MSGHSKWKQIKYKKAASDAKKGKLFSKISRTITLAAKELGPDPKINIRLASAIEDARAVNMPNDNIERAVKKRQKKKMAISKKYSTKHMVPEDLRSLLPLSPIIPTEPQAK